MTIGLRTEKAIKKVIEAIKSRTVSCELKKNTLVFSHSSGIFGPEGRIIARFTLQSLIKKRYARRKK